MHCKDAQNLFDEYLDGMLDSRQREQLVRHTESCPDCQQELTGLESLRSALRAMPVQPARENFAAEALQAAVATGDRTERKHPGFLHWFGAGFAGAMALHLTIFAATGGKGRRCWRDRRFATGRRN